MRETMRNATKGGILLRPGGTGTKVRNVETGRVLPCCWSDCEKDGSSLITVEVPHNQPRWKDPTTGAQEMLVYIFCSQAHKTEFVKGSIYEDRA
jgi:hypothetical protein